MADPQRPHPLDYVELPVADVAAARAFYRAALGWETRDYGPDYAGVVGGVITFEPFAFPGGRRFQFRDPDGNEINVYSAD